MDTHKNACRTSKGREAMVRAVVDGRVTKAATAREYHTTPKTVGKWVARFLAEGVEWFARPRECQKFCVRDFCEGGFYVSVHGA